MSEQAELERIRSAYAERDAAPAASAYSWDRPGYRFYMQQLEWDLLRELSAAGVSLSGAAALEVGCGSGYFLHRLRDYGASRAAGIDLMEDRVAQARERYPALEVRAGDASALPYADGEFDVVTQFTCLSSVLDRGLRARIAAEMWRVTRPGGAVVSYDMRPAPRALTTLRRLRGAAAADAAGTPTRPVTLDELRAAWGAGALGSRTVALNFDLTPIAARGRLLAEAAAAVPLLRSHLLVVARKPPGQDY